jgi:hypothetical protein
MCGIGRLCGADHTARVLHEPEQSPDCKTEDLEFFQKCAEFIERPVGMPDSKQTNLSQRGSVHESCSELAMYKVSTPSSVSSL